jgi:addiction module HigA family antidote
MAHMPANRSPTHPGEVLLQEFLEPLGLTQRDLAQAMHVPYQRVNDIVRQRRGVTPSTALRLAKFFGNTAEFWMSLQLRWDLAQAQAAEQEELERIEPRAPAVEEPLPYAVKGDVQRDSIQRDSIRRDGIPPDVVPPDGARQVDALQDMIREGTAAQAVPAQVQLPMEVFAMLERRSKTRGATPAQQIVEMVIAFLQGEVDPILQPDDPLLSIPAAEGTGLGDLASDHDRCLYRKDW